jgi:hypothetical protein
MHRAEIFNLVRDSSLQNIAITQSLQKLVIDSGSGSRLTRPAAAGCRFLQARELCGLARFQYEIERGEVNGVGLPYFEKQLWTEQ